MYGQTFLCFFRAYSTGFQQTLYRVDAGGPNTKIEKSKDQTTTIPDVLSYIVDTLTTNKIKPIAEFNTDTATILDNLLAVLLSGASDNYAKKNSIKISLLDRDFGDGLKPAIKVTTVHQNIKSVSYYAIEEPVV